MSCKKTSGQEKGHSPDSFLDDDEGLTTAWNGWLTYLWLLGWLVDISLIALHSSDGQRVTVSVSDHNQLQSWQKTSENTCQYSKLYLKQKIPNILCVIDSGVDEWVFCAIGLWRAGYLGCFLAFSLKGLWVVGGGWVVEPSGGNGFPRRWFFTSPLPSPPIFPLNTFSSESYIFLPSMSQCPRNVWPVAIFLDCL